MANDGSTQVPPNSTGNKIDCSSLSVGGATVYRQRVVLSDNTHSANFATVSAGSLQVIVENASLAVTGAVSIAAGTSKIGYLQKISASVTVQGNVGIAAGTNHIGEVNISLMPAVVVTSITNAINVSAMPAVAIATGTNKIGSIKFISATVNVAGSLTIGGTTGGTSSTAASSFTLIGGNDGSIGRVALMDAAGHQIISGTVALTTLNGLGKIDGISAAVSIASLNGLGKIDGISANVNVVLQTGTNNIGTVNNISAAVSVASLNGLGKIDGISANVNVVLQSGANNIGTINNISAVVGVNIGAISSGVILPVNLVAMSAAALPVLIAAQSAGLALRAGGRVKTSASSTVADSNTVPLWMDKNGRLVVVNHHPSLPPSASHGPKTVIISTSASVALIAAPGAGLVAYVDSICVTNGSSTLTLFQAYELSATAIASAAICGYLAASGGGFVRTYDPPLRVSANTVLNGRIKPNVSQVIVDIHFHVGVD